MIRTGLDCLLEAPNALLGRRYGLLSHVGAVNAELVPAHLALTRAGARPAVVFGPEHGLHGFEQDMVAAEGGVEPWTRAPLRSLYGDDESSLRPSTDAFEGLDLLIVDLQDVGARYYTYAATAVWAAEVALSVGCEVWVLDRPNPLGGVEIEGNLRRDEYASFVGAFELPMRHGLTVGELVRLEARRRRWEGVPRVVEMEGWSREQTVFDWGRPWVAPSPNLPTAQATWLYPGLCLVEGTTSSEGRGTSRPFQLVGAPGVDPIALAQRIDHPGVVAAPTYFRPQAQKHAGAVCGGVWLHIVDPRPIRPVRLGVELLSALAEVAPQAFAWRDEAYEFVTDRPAIDLLAGDEALRLALDQGSSPAEWMASWEAEEQRFAEERESILLY